MELRNNTVVKGRDDTPGNVYSKNFIRGAKNDYTPSTGECKNSASAIYGSAWAVGSIEKLAPTDSGVCITASASATLIEQCYVNDKQYSPNTPSSECPSPNVWEHIDSVPVRDLPDLGDQQVKTYLTDHGDVHTGYCKLTGSGNASDCLGGASEIGNIKFDGDLEIDPDPSAIIQFTGPIWVTGDLIIRQNSTIMPKSTSISQITVVDGTITSYSNVTYKKNVDAFLLFISTFLSGPDSTDPTFCDNPAISLSSNNESVLFFSKVGCIIVDTGTATGGFKGALLGEAIRVKNNTEIEYDPDLQTSIFGLTNTGGWQIEDFKEY